MTYLQGLPGIFATGIGGGILFGIRQWWGDWKERRLALPEPVRNAGFWTDRKVWWAQTLFLVVLIGMPVSGVLIVLSSNSPWLMNNITIPILRAL